MAVVALKVLNWLVSTIGEVTGATKVLVVAGLAAVVEPPPQAVRLINASSTVHAFLLSDMILRSVYCFGTGDPTIGASFGLHANGLPSGAQQVP